MQSNVLAAALAMVFAAATGAQAQDTSAAPIDPAIFPPAKRGMVQHVLNLPAAETEGNMLAEIVVGQMLEVDCNRVVIGADLDVEDLDGWGYNYFEVEDVGRPASTMMACPDARKTQELIHLNFGNDAFQRYNSKVPLVIYAPEGLVVGYRVWSTDGKLHQNAE